MAVIRPHFVSNAKTGSRPAPFRIALSIRPAAPWQGLARHNPSRIPVAAIAEAATAEVVSSSASEEADSLLQQRSLPDGAKQQDRAIVVGERPAGNSLLRRLEQVPQTLLRAMTSSEQHTYKTIATVASAQGTLNLPGQVLLYVPFTKGRSFTAIVLTTSSRVLQAGGSGSIPRLQVRANTSAEALAKTLSFDLIKHGSAMLDSSGAAATAKAAAALQLVRQQLLSRGYEVGVVPRFEERKVVLQELPVPCVNLPRNDWKPLDTAAAAAQAMLAKQQRVQLLLPPAQLGRLSGMLASVMQPVAKEQQREGQAGKDGKVQKGRSQEDKKRLLLVWPPSTADQLLESLEQLNQFATASLADGDSAAVAAAAAAGIPAAAVAAPGLLPAAEVDDMSLVQLQVRRSRLISIPSPQDGASAGPGLREDRKAAAATADSSVSGLAGAIEARVARAGAAWLWTDISKEAHANAWRALMYASSKMDAADGAGGLLALVDVQQVVQQAPRSAGNGNRNQQPQPQQPEQAAAAGSDGSEQQQQVVEEQQQQQLWQVKVQQQAKAQLQQRQQQQRKAVKKQQEPEPSYRLKMLIVRDSDIARSILQSPNSPLEVSVSADLWPLLKFATAANAFLPTSRTTGTGGLVMLPAVLPTPSEPAAAVAADYRFDDQKQQLVPYAIRLQRFTGKLPQGMEVDDSQQLRVSLSTDPIKLRDAIVAKVLQQQPASVRFVGPLGRTPPLLTIAMAAVAAARVRLQQKGAPLDVGVMPYAETLIGPAAAAAEAGQADADGAAAAAAAVAAGGSAGKGRRGKAAVRRQQGPGAAGVQAGRVVYSLCLVPMPAVAPVAEAAASIEEVQQAA